ncbi:hypothetical protein PIB30_116558 [Stylosanthes scabra]|uniref:hAT-like transposase RNase-H fold domain-containing protein n=1 Tax=Stylosanthes scabra TaxID=79078 RepID=A0ABU6Q1W4_9FABA|nr:hypothetical protein [Stylosanthes scabra]
MSLQDWNSIYLMLESALKCMRGFVRLSFKDKKYEFCPSEDEWNRAKEICDFLNSFYKITTLMSRQSYPTSNLYFMQIWKIECLLKQYVTSEDEVMRNMTQPMTDKFDKYWNEYSIILSLGAILDPHIKFHVLKYCLNKVEPDTAQAKLANIKEGLYSLFESYAERFPQNNGSSGSNGTHIGDPFNRGDDPLALDIPEDLRNISFEVDALHRKYSLDLYLDESVLDMNSKVDVL